MNQVIQVAVTAIWVLCVSTFSTPSMATKIQGGPEDKGGACHVVSGPNAGKSGVYSGDGFCCGTGGPSGEGWGCTECTGSNAGKCKDAGHIEAAWLQYHPEGEMRQKPLQPNRPVW